MSPVGTKLPIRDVRCPVAVGGKPDMVRKANSVEIDPCATSGRPVRVVAND
jgi:hypothetical protein